MRLGKNVTISSWDLLLGNCWSTVITLFYLIFFSFLAWPILKTSPITSQYSSIKSSPLFSQTSQLYNSIPYNLLARSGLYSSGSRRQRWWGFFSWRDSLSSPPEVSFPLRHLSPCSLLTISSYPVLDPKRQHKVTPSL
jgi:hypothetical protein